MLLGGQSLLIVMTLRIDFAYMLPLVLTAAIFAAVTIGPTSANMVSERHRQRLTLPALSAAAI